MIDRILEVNGVYRHYKTKQLYKIVALPTIESTGEGGERLVVYRSLIDGKEWSRPVADFTAVVTNQRGARVLRFDPEYRFVVRIRHASHYAETASHSALGAIAVANSIYALKLQEALVQAERENWSIGRRREEFERISDLCSPAEVLIRPDILKEVPTRYAMELYSNEDCMVLAMTMTRCDKDHLLFLDDMHSEIGLDSARLYQHVRDRLLWYGYDEQWARDHMFCQGGVDSNGNTIFNIRHKLLLPAKGTNA